VIINNILRDLINTGEVVAFMDDILVGTEEEKRHNEIVEYHDLAKQLSHYLYFFSFLFLFFYLGLTTQKEVQESVTSQVSYNHSYMTGSHSITSHDVT